MALYGTVPPFQDPEIPIEDTEVSKVIGLGLNHLVMALNATMWGPPVMERWFINPMNTIVIGTINHIVIGVMFTNLAIVNGGLTRGTYCCGVVLQLRSRERSHSSRCETFGVTLQGAPLGVESPGHAQGHRQGLGTARRLHDLP